MSDGVTITGIIAVAIIVVMAIFKDRLKAFFFKADSEGVRATIKAGNDKTSSGITIKKTSQIGSNSEIKVSKDNVNIEEFEQKGKGHKLEV